MGKTTELTKKLAFRVKWTFMPRQKKYAYLWARTRRSLAQDAVHPRDDEDTIMAG